MERLDIIYKAIHQCRLFEFMYKTTESTDNSLKPKGDVLLDKPDESASLAEYLKPSELTLEDIFNNLTLSR